MLVKNKKKASWEKLILLTIFVALVSCLSCVRKEELIIGKSIPKFDLIDEQGHAINSKDYLGKVLLIDFWASYCKPCIKLSKDFLLPLYENIDSSVFRILSISTDTDTLAWKQALKKYEMPWEHVCLSLNFNEVAKDYKIRGIPTTFLVDKQGKFIGRFDSKDSLLNNLAELLNKDTILFEKKKLKKATSKFKDWKEYVSEMVYETENFIYSNFKFPVEAIKANVSDSITYGLEIGKGHKLKFSGYIYGNSYGTEIKDSIGYGCDEEFIRVIGLLKDWKSYDYFKEGTFSFSTRFYIPPRKPIKKIY